MDEPSRRFLIEQLDSSEREMIDFLDGLTAEELAFRPDASSWTILECLEHIINAESLSLRAILKRATVLEQPLMRRERSAAFFETSSNRAGSKWTSPERLVPRGVYQSREEAVTAFREVREAMRDYVAQTSDDLDSRMLTHPLFGELTCYEWVLTISGHTRRHLSQIQDLRNRHRTGTAAAT